MISKLEIRCFKGDFNKRGSLSFQEMVPYFAELVMSPSSALLNVIGQGIRGISVAVFDNVLTDKTVFYPESKKISLSDICSKMGMLDTVNGDIYTGARPSHQTHVISYGYLHGSKKMAETLGFYRALVNKKPPMCLGFPPLLQRFLGKDDKSNHLHFDTPYNRKIIKALFYRPENISHCIRVVFKKHSQNPTVFFKNQLCRLVELSNTLKRPAVFLSEVTKKNKACWIGGIIKDEQLWLIDSMGISIHTSPNYYVVLKKLQNQEIPLFKRVVLSPNNLLLCLDNCAKSLGSDTEVDQNLIAIKQEALKNTMYQSTAAILLEIMHYVVNQCTIEKLNSLWKRFETLEPKTLQTNRENTLLYYEMKIEEFYLALEILLQEKNVLTYQCLLEDIREVHYELLQMLLTSGDSMHTTPPSQVVFEVMMDGDNPKKSAFYSLLEKELNADKTEIRANHSSQQNNSISQTSMQSLSVRWKEKKIDEVPLAVEQKLQKQKEETNQQLEQLKKELEEMRKQMQQLATGQVSQPENGYDNVQQANQARAALGYQHTALLSQPGQRATFNNDNKSRSQNENGQNGTSSQSSSSSKSSPNP